MIYAKLVKLVKNIANALKKTPYSVALVNNLYQYNRIGSIDQKNNFVIMLLCLTYRTDLLDFLDSLNPSFCMFLLSNSREMYAVSTLIYFIKIVCIRTYEYIIIFFC